MPTQLSIYNGALTILGETKLASLTENREPRHEMDEIWANNFIRRVLQRGQWNFAIRSIQPAVSASVTPSFGYRNAFEKPTDFVRAAGICQDEYFNVPLLQYETEGNYWFADLDDIYIRYVSDDSQFGGDLSLWADNFTEFAEHYMARKVAPRITGLDFDIDELKQQERDALAEAKATDAMEQAAKFQPESSWVSSRRGRGSNRDRGRRTTLIG